MCSLVVTQFGEFLLESLFRGSLLRTPLQSVQTLDGYYQELSLTFLEICYLVNLANINILRVDCSSLVVPEEIEEISEFEKEPAKRVEELFELETLGINDIETVEEQFISELKYDDDYYSLSLPWHEHHDILPDNYEVSVARLNSTLKRLRKEPDLLKEYNTSNVNSHRFRATLHLRVQNFRATRIQDGPCGWMRLFFENKYNLSIFNDWE